jgi:hypothetical protein
MRRAGDVLQLVGAGLVVAAAFVVAVPLGLLVAGAAVALAGVAVNRV